MGVVHKLKSEIAEEIIRMKRDDPKLSCRRIAEIISEKHNISISKSSVNIFLKKNEKDTEDSTTNDKKVFQIPEKRKEEISRQMMDAQEKTSSDSEGKKDHSSLEPAREAQRSITDIPEKGGEREGKAGKSFEDKINGVLDEDDRREIIRLRNVRSNNQSPAFKGAGLFLIRALIGEILDFNEIQNIFDKHDIILPRHGWSILQLAIYHSILEKDDAEKYLKPNTGFLTGLLAGGEELQSRSFREAEIHKDVVLEFQSLLEQMSTVVGYVKIQADDGDVFYLDSSLCVLSGSKPVISQGTLLQTFRRINEQIFGAHEALIVLPVPGDGEDIRETAKEFLKVLNNDSNKKIAGVSVHSPNGEELACFETVPDIKRTACLVIPAESAFFQELNKSTKWAAKDHQYHELLDDIFFYTSVRYPFDISEEHQETCRVLTVWDEDGHRPEYSMLINNESAELRASLADILKRWQMISANLFGAPDKTVNHEDGDRKVAPEGRQRDNNEECRIRDCVELIKNTVMELFKIRFLNSNASASEIIAMLRDIGLLEGKVDLDRNNIVTLCVPDDYKHRDALISMIGWINRCGIPDLGGRKHYAQAINVKY